MNTNDNLDSMTDAELSEVFAVEVAAFSAQWFIIKGGYYFRPLARGYTAHKHDAGRFDEAYARDYVSTSHGELRMEREEIPPFATSADAVLVYLEARGRFNLSYFKGWSCQCLMGPAENQFGHAPTLARSICLALIRAKRSEKGQP